MMRGTVYLDVLPTVDLPNGRSFRHVWTVDTDSPDDFRRLCTGRASDYFHLWGTPGVVSFGPVGRAWR